MFNNPPLNRSIVCLLLISGLVVGRADDEVRSTQEELRRRNIYFGDIDGRQSPELQEALKHYQTRKGLAPTGTNDHDTLRSLGVVSRGPNEPAPKELELPEEPVLKSDSKINVRAEAREVAATTGISVASVAPETIASGRRGDDDAATARERSRAEHRGATETRDVRSFATKNAQLPANVQAYVTAYLKAVSGNRLEDELHFYADHVDYLGNGRVDRRIIEHSLKKYYARWPSRSYSPPEAMGYRAIPSRGEIVVSFRTAFRLRNGSVKARGRTDNEIVINAATADPRIISIRETRVR